MPELTRHGIAVIGVSRDSVASHDKFKSKYGLPFPLASDLDGKVSEAYGTWVEKSMYGRKYLGVDRATFLIDEKGIVRAVWRKVKVPGHVEEVLKATGEQGVQAVIDMVGGDYLPRNLKCLAEEGRHVSIAVQRGAVAEIPIFDIMRRRLTLTGSTLRPRPVEFKTLVADELERMVWPHVRAGTLKPWTLGVSSATSSRAGMTMHSVCEPARRISRSWRSRRRSTTTGRP